MIITKDKNGNIKSIHIHKDDENLANEFNKLDIKDNDKQYLISKVAGFEESITRIKNRKSKL